MTFRGVRRLDAALSNAPPKTLDKPARGSPLPPKKILTRSRGVAEKASRKVREVRKVILSRRERKGRKEMKGGNGATIGSGITQFANGEPKRWNYNATLNLSNRNSQLVTRHSIISFLKN